MKQTNNLVERPSVRLAVDSWLNSRINLGHGNTMNGLLVNRIEPMLLVRYSRSYMDSTSVSIQHGSRAKVCSVVNVIPK